MCHSVTGTAAQESVQVFGSVPGVCLTLQWHRRAIAVPTSRWCRNNDNSYLAMPIPNLQTSKASLRNFVTSSPLPLPYLRTAGLTSLGLPPRSADLAGPPRKSTNAWAPRLHGSAASGHCGNTPNWAGDNVVMYTYRRSTGWRGCGVWGNYGVRGCGVWGCGGRGAGERGSWLRRGGS